MLLEKKFQQHIVDMTRAWRNSAGKYDWHDSEYTVRAAASLAGDMGLSEENMMMFSSDSPCHRQERHIFPSDSNMSPAREAAARTVYAKSCQAYTLAEFRQTLAMSPMCCWKNVPAAHCHDEGLAKFSEGV